MDVSPANDDPLPVTMDTGDLRYSPKHHGNRKQKALFISGPNMDL